jgi:hypothetical protein
MREPPPPTRKYLRGAGESMCVDYFTDHPKPWLSEMGPPKESAGAE